MYFLMLKNNILEIKIVFICIFFFRILDLFWFFRDQNNV